MMKKLIISAVLLGVILVNANAFYFDFEFGVAKDPKLEFNGVKQVAKPGVTEIAVELGFKIGYISFQIERMPIYMTLSGTALGHRFSLGRWYDSSDYFQLNSLLVGMGFVAYPVSFLQLSGVFGYSFSANIDSDYGFELFDKSKFGYGYELSAALKLGSRPSGFLIGAKYLWINTILETGDKQAMSGIFFFVKYAFR
ncbi:MAG: hypothetical protein LBI14_02585 [Treponema sp.]|jgi:hypothetical protein|nr:hypothetical protein [Treponema sp.]